MVLLPYLQERKEMKDLSCPDCGGNIFLPITTCGMVEPIVIECVACPNRWNRFGLNLTRENGDTNEL
jgi:hypothetical protein